MARVLVVEDHVPLAKMVAEGLSGAGYTVDLAGDGSFALTRVGEREYDAIVLDWMLPKLDGLSVLKKLRADGDRTPVIMLTARDEVPDRVTGLDSGADDYLVKPFALDELISRLHAIIRRDRGAAASVIEVEDLRVDTRAKQVLRGGTEIVLSAREYAILECLALNRGRVVSREQLLAHAYDMADEPASNVIDVYVGYLRKKIDKGFERRLIQTRRGLGYLLGGEA